MLDLETIFQGLPLEGSSVGAVDGTEDPEWISSASAWGCGFGWPSRAARSAGGFTRESRIASSNILTRISGGIMLMKVSRSLLCSDTLVALF